MSKYHILRSINVLLLIILPLLFIINCSDNKNSHNSAAVSHNPTAKNHLALGTASRVTIYDQEPARAEEILKRSFTRIDEIEASMTLYNSGSEIARVNRNAGGQFTSVSEETFLVITQALEIAAQTGGAFDPTVGPLVKAWGIGSDNPMIPGEQEMAMLLDLVDYREVELSREGGDYLVRLKRPDMMLDLGGIAKGYAADAVKEVITGMGSSSALINLGGNILLKGSKPDGTPWRIGIQDPDANRGAYVLILNLTSGTVVTSGTYERFFYDASDQRFHHILDPWDGYPVENGLESVTIVTENSAYADGLSTGVFVLGLERGWELVESLPGVDAVFITEDQMIYITPGITSYTLSNQEFTIRSTLQSP